MIHLFFTISPPQFGHLGLKIILSNASIGLKCHFFSPLIIFLYEHDKHITSYDPCIQGGSITMKFTKR